MYKPYVFFLLSLFVISHDQNTLRHFHVGFLAKMAAKQGQTELFAFFPKKSLEVVVQYASQ